MAVDLERGAGLDAGVEQSVDVEPDSERAARCGDRSGVRWRAPTGCGWWRPAGGLCRNVQVERRMDACVGPVECRDERGMVVDGPVRTDVQLGTVQHGGPVAGRAHRPCGRRSENPDVMRAASLAALYHDVADELRQRPQPIRASSPSRQRSAIGTPRACNPSCNRTAWHRVERVGVYGDTRDRKRACICAVWSAP